MRGGSSAARARRTAIVALLVAWNLLLTVAVIAETLIGSAWCDVFAVRALSAVCSGHVATPVVDLGIGVRAGGSGLSCRAGVRRSPRQLRSGQGDAPRVADRKRGTGRLDTPQELEYRNPAAVRAYESKGQVVHVTPGQKLQVQLQPIKSE